MKLFVIALLLSLATSKTIEKHYHIHMAGLDARTQRQLLQMRPDHKGFFGNVWCYLKNPANKNNRQACINNANNGGNNASVSTTTTVTSKPASNNNRYLSAERHALFAEFDEMITAHKAECYEHSQTEASYHACVKDVEEQAKAHFAALGNPSHRGFWGRFKCLISHAFNKDNREQCYRDVQNADDSKNAAIALNAQANTKGNTNVTPQSTTTTSSSTTTANNGTYSRRLSAHKAALVKEFDHKVNWARAKCYKYFYNKQKYNACVNSLQTTTTAHLVAIGDPSHKAFWGKFKCLVKYLFNKDKREQCYQDAQQAEDNKNAAVAINASASANANKGNPNPPANSPAPQKATTTSTSTVSNKRRLSPAHGHVVDSTGCFFKYMFNSQKRAQCNADAAAKRDARNKKSAQDNEAKRKSDANNAAQKKAADEAAARAAKKRVGLNAQGKASHNTYKVIETGLYY